MSEDKLDLEEVKSFRQALEILFDGSGAIDIDEILMKFDDLIEEVERITEYRDGLKAGYKKAISEVRELAESKGKLEAENAMLKRERDSHWNSYLAENKAWQEQKETILKLEAKVDELEKDNFNMSQKLSGG